MPTDNHNVGIALALSAGAGAATALGAAVVFVPRLVQLVSRKTLASGLGLSAGVMTYVSLVDLVKVSNDSFLQGGHSETDAYIYATLSFFGGVVLMVALNSLVSYFLSGQHQKVTGGESKDNAQGTAHFDEEIELDERQAACMCCAEDPAADLERYQHMAHKIQEYQEVHRQGWQGTDIQEGINEHRDNKDDEDVEKKTREDEADDLDSFNKNNSKPSLSDDGDNAAADAAAAKEARKLMHVGIKTALAIGLHNFPEGLATFVATLADPTVGAVLAVAIAIHNIPEGLCVALPIYYATGSRWKGFGWAVLSGVSEPVAALLGWAVLAKFFSDTVFGALFGMVAGMMVIISVRELLPTAHRYDPEDTVVTYSFIVGMAVMASSLVLFVV